jgi:prolyl 4-hydroxylase
MPRSSASSNRDLRGDFTPAVIDGALSEADCAELIGQASPRLAPATIQAHAHRRVASVRICKVARVVVPPRVADQIVGVLGCSRAQLEPLEIVQYDPGGRFKPHYDYVVSKHFNESGGSRFATALYFLNEGYEGGQLRFPAMSPVVTMEPKRGRLVHWPNVRDGERVTASLHEGTKVVSGVKWIAVVWAREWSGAPEYCDTVDAVYAAQRRAYDCPRAAPVLSYRGRASSAPAPLRPTPSDSGSLAT